VIRTILIMKLMITTPQAENILMMATCSSFSI
jgi:hypothetical protein